MSNNFKGWRAHAKPENAHPGFRKKEADAPRQHKNPILAINEAAGITPAAYNAIPAPTAAAPKEKTLAELKRDQLRQAMAERVKARKYPVIVGIDPGRETGFAVWDKKSRRLLRVETMTITQAARELLLLQEEYGPQIMVRVEDARLRKYLPEEKNASEYRGKLMGAGSIKRDCQIWEDLFEEIGIDYEFLKPRPGLTKWEPEYFERLTGWKGRTSNHARDAAANIYGL